MSFASESDDVYRNRIVRYSAVPSQILYMFTRTRIGFNTMSLMTVLLLYTTMNALGAAAIFYTGIYNLVRMNRNSWSLFFFDPWLLIFAQVVCAIGIVIHYRRYREIKRGKWWYSHSEGISRLHTLFPDLSLSMIERVVEPAAGAVCALVVFVILSKTLGLWILWASLCAAFHQFVIADVRFKKAIDDQDALILTNIQILNAKGLQDLQRPDFLRFEAATADARNHGQQAPAAAPATNYGLPAGGEEELFREQMQRRLKRQQETQQVDNGEPLDGTPPPRPDGAGREPLQ